MTPCVLGIDPGLDGGIACLALDGRSLWARPMPVLAGRRREVDVAELARMIRLQSGVRLAVVELPFVRPGQQAFGALRFGIAVGQVLGCVAALGLPLETVTPQRWKRAVLAGTAKDKAAAVAYAAKRFPTLSLLASARCRKPHDGIADALCLGEFARRIAVGEVRTAS